MTPQSRAAGDSATGTFGGGDAYDEAVAGVLRRTLRYSRERDYTGWDYWDGTSSPVLDLLPVENKWLTIIVQEGIKRAPVNLRPVFGVPKRRNFKGAALFAMANDNAGALFADEVRPGGEDVDYASEADRLGRWLVDQRVRGYHGFAGSHRHSMQELDGRREPDEGDVVSTSFAVKALLRLADCDPAFGTAARSARAFVLSDLDYAECEAGATVNYATCDDGSHYTTNAVALAARLFCDLYAADGDDADRERAARLLDFVVANQAASGGWTYRVPSDASHLSMDNHHNGFVLECLARYGQVTGDDRYRDALERGYRFYRETLFEPDGAPNWEEDATYPRDIHAAAQGILVGSWLGDLAFARRVLDWTLRTLYAGGGRFWFRQTRLGIRRITLMRWCQAWMAYAISEYLLAARVAGSDDDGPDRFADVDADSDRLGVPTAVPPTVPAGPGDEDGEPGSRGIRGQ